jgi:hypothetical protein
MNESNGQALGQGAFFTIIPRSKLDLDWQRKRPLAESCFGDAQWHFEDSLASATQWGLQTHLFGGANAVILGEYAKAQ